MTCVVLHQALNLKCQSRACLNPLHLFCHHGRKLLEADEPVTVAVRLGHHPAHLVLTQLLPHVSHHLLQLRQTGNRLSCSLLGSFLNIPDKSIPILIKNIESLPQTFKLYLQHCLNSLSALSQLSDGNTWSSLSGDGRGG